MKKFFVVFSLILMVFAISSCKEKRCACTITRVINPQTNETMVSHCLEPKAGHANCSELDANWTASDSTGNMLMKECVDEI